MWLQLIIYQLLTQEVINGLRGVIVYVYDSIRNKDSLTKDELNKVLLRFDNIIKNLQNEIKMLNDMITDESNGISIIQTNSEGVLISGSSVSLKKKRKDKEIELKEMKSNRKFITDQLLLDQGNYDKEEILKGLNSVGKLVLNDYTDVGKRKDVDEHLDHIFNPLYKKVVDLNNTILSTEVSMFRRRKPAANRVFRGRGRGREGRRFNEDNNNDNNNNLFIIEENRRSSSDPDEHLFSDDSI